MRASLSPHASALFPKKNYNYVGEIFDENNKEATLERDRDLQLNYKTIMNNHWSKQYWK